LALLLLCLQTTLWLLVVVRAAQMVAVLVVLAVF
jgi:hypothetical protein